MCGRFTLTLDPVRFKPCLNWVLLSILFNPAITLLHRNLCQSLKTLTRVQLSYTAGAWYLPGRTTSILGTA